MEDSPENLVESDIKHQCTKECKSASDYDNSSCCSISKKKSCHGISRVNDEVRQTDRSGDADFSNTNFILNNDDSFMGDSSCIEMGENNYIANYLAISDLMVHATGDSSNSLVLDGENNMFDFFLNVDPQGAPIGEKSFHNGSQRIYTDDEDMEVSSTTSMSSVLGRLLNLEFDNQFDEDDSLSTNVRSLSKEIEPDELYKGSSRFEMAPRVSSPEDESCRGVLIANDKLERNLSREDEDKETNVAITLDSEILSGQVKNVAVESFEIQDASLEIEDTYIHKYVLQDSRVRTNISSADENGAQDKRDSQKHKRRPLLKTVAQPLLVSYFSCFTSEKAMGAARKNTIRIFRLQRSRIRSDVQQRRSS